MIISRVPLRITLGGGGTDLRSYFALKGGYVISLAIRKYITIIINENLNSNKLIREDLDLLHKSIEKLTNNIQSNTALPNVSNINNLNLENEKVKFYQEENLRIGGELLETKKKFDMVKNEIEKYEQQRSNLISKINSVNEALENTNVVTNVFENEISKPKVSIIDHKNLEKNNDQKQDINEEIRKIFSK